MKNKRRLIPSSFLLLASIALLGACANRTDISPYSYGGEGMIPPAESGPAPIVGAPAAYSSSLQQSQVVSRQNVPMSDEQSAAQQAGTTRSHQTASSETVTKKGKIKKQTSTTEEIIETDTSTFVANYSDPSSDQDAR